MPQPMQLPSNVVILHPQLPRLSPRERARLELIDLFQELDEDSQRVLVAQLALTHARLRTRTPAAALVRGERGPVEWRRGEGERVLVGPESRRWLYQRAHA
jgi:hypothetical protein